ITPVLGGSYCMQGPMDEIDQSIEKNMVYPKTLRKLVRRYMSQKVLTKSESGTCNVCSAPCSSCMHLSLVKMELKNDEFSDETDRVAVASQYSISEDTAGDNLQHTPSEASNLLSVNSSHDSYSENVESKAILRPSDASDALEDVETQKTFSSKDGSKGVEGHDDNISCASRASDANAAFSSCNKDLDSKNSSRSTASDCSLGSAKVLSSQKLDLSELPSIKEVDASSSSQRLQSPYSHSGRGKSTVGGSSEISSKIHPKSDADIDNSSGDPPDKADKRSNDDEQDKSNQLDELPDKQESLSQAVSGDESDESDATEHDVKVCDICGDAGREDLLAICSRCTDGAEHTYCMREMLQKVPEGYWLCEECKLAEETENQKQGSDAEGKRANKLGSIAQNLGKRHAENQEGASALKRQAVETNMASPKSLSPSRVASLSREGSFKNLDRGKARPSPQISLGNHSGNDMPEAARSPTSGPRLQTPKGTLLKSNSFNTFNSKPKVKLVDEVVIQKQKSSREHTSLDTKEESARMMGKSMSFKSNLPGRLNTGESKFKMVPSKYHHVQDIKGLKPVKERVSVERKNFSKLDRSSSTVSTPKVDQRMTPRSDSIAHSSASNHRESKGQTDGKLSTLSRSNSNLARKGVENAVTSAIGSSSINGRGSSEQKLNQVNPKEEPSSSSSWAAERQHNNVNGVMLDGQSRSLDSTNQGEKSRESSVGRSKSLMCLKCKEMGHTAESCPVSLASGADISAPRTSREDINKDDKLKAAIEAAIRMRPGICERTQDPSSVSNKAKNMITVEGTHEGQTNIHNQMSIGNMKQLNSHSTDAVAVVSSVGNLSARDTSTPATLKMSAIPDHEFIWQGAFEVHKSGKLPDLFGGIQAHLSTLASPKVLEVVSTFPHKVSLNEVPRLSTWPTQFHDNGPKEDNIALYFFAKDLESFEKNYKVLLDNMVKNDLALKGNFEGVELLIFPSNQLPQNCQRWNTLFFLWGVFRGRRAKFSNSSATASIPDASMVHLERQISSDMPQPADDKPAACDNSCNVAPVSSIAEKTCIRTERDSENKSSLEQTYVEKKAKLEQQDGIVDSNFLSRIATSSTQVHPEMKCTSSSPDESKVPVCRSDTELKPCIEATETKSSSVKVEKEEMHVRRDYPPLPKVPIGKQEAVQSVAGKIDGDCVKIRDLKDDGYADKRTSLRGDLDCRQLNHRKRTYLDLTETVSEVSTDTCQAMPWSEVKRVSVEEGSDSKKLKTGFSGIYQYSSPIDRGPFSDSLASDRHNMGSCSSIEEKRCDIGCEEKVIPEDLGSSERFFFPVGSHHSREFRLGDNSRPWKELLVKEEDKVEDVSPNLELALGAETRPPNPPNKGILPFLAGTVDNQDRPLDKASGKEEEDDVSASLSLSLSFPFPEKEHSVKSVSKTEQLLPERHPVNTSLLLFGGFPEK
ncbi:Zinc finger, PHD-type, partial [Corchorus capsularis]